MDKYEKYESDCKKIRIANQHVIDEFQKYLKAKKLSDKTIDKHVSNVDFYINDFLLYEEPLKPHEGVDKLGHFLGFWFIRKALWASVTSIKENISSLKHFYTYLHQTGEVSLEELHEMKQVIKENKDEWLETLKAYDNPDIDLDEIW